MKELIVALASKYNLHTINDSLAVYNEPVPLNVGFLGEFSTGKSSLVNALIGKKILPVMETPTTGSITEIITDEQETDILCYRRNEYGQLEEISAVEFSDITCGKQKGVAVLSVPPQGILNSGIRLIDTPGISSLDETHVDITFGYLPHLDGAVICGNIDKGGLPQSVFNFLGRQDVASMKDRFIFVLGFTDLKLPDAIRAIKAETCRQLADRLYDGSSPDEVASRVAAISAKRALETADKNELVEFCTAYDMHIVGRKSTMMKQRKAKLLKDLADQTLQSLRSILAHFKISDDDIKAKIGEIETNMDILERTISEQDEKVKKLESQVARIVFDVLGSHFSALSHSDPEKYESLIDGMRQDLVSRIEPLIKAHFASFEIGAIHTFTIDLQQKIESISRRVELGEHIVTGGLLAAFTGFQSLWVEGAQATAGAAASATGKIVARKAAKTVGKAAAKKVGKAAIKSALLKMAQTAYKIIEDINPVHHLATAIRKKIISGELLNSQAAIADQIAHYIADQVDVIFEVEVLQPLQEQMKFKRDELEEARRAKNKSETYRMKMKKDLEFEIYQLSSSISQT